MCCSVSTACPTCNFFHCSASNKWLCELNPADLKEYEQICINGKFVLYLASRNSLKYFWNRSEYFNLQIMPAEHWFGNHSNSDFPWCPKSMLQLVFHFSRMIQYKFAFFEKNSWRVSGPLQLIQKHRSLLNVFRTFLDFVRFYQNYNDSLS